MPALIAERLETVRGGVDFGCEVEGGGAAHGSIAATRTAKHKSQFEGKIHLMKYIGFAAELQAFNLRYQCFANQSSLMSTKSLLLLMLTRILLSILLFLLLKFFMSSLTISVFCIGLFLPMTQWLLINFRFKHQILFSSFLVIQQLTDSCLACCFQLLSPKYCTLLSLSPSEWCCGRPRPWEHY